MLIGGGYRACAQYFPHLAFQKFYDNVGEDVATRIVRAHDGQLLIGGHTIMPDSAHSGCANIWIIKVDTLGELLWDQEINLSGCEMLRDMILTHDGGVLFTGVTSSLISHEEKGDEGYWGDYFIGKMDSAGTVEWLQSYGGSRLDQAFGIVAGIYREYMVVGSSHSRDGDVAQNSGMSDIWTLKIDNRGKTRYSKVLGGSRNDWGLATTRCMNGDYVIAGLSDSPELDAGIPGLYGNGVVIRLTQSGNVVWQRLLPTRWGGYLSCLTETPDETLLLAGNYASEPGDRDFWWVALDKNGSQRQRVVIPGPNDEYITSLDRCADGGILLGGYSVSRGFQGLPYKGGDDFWLLRTQPDGELIWRRAYGGTQHERCHDVLVYRPGVYYAVGEKVNRFTRANGSIDKDFWLLRVEEYPQDSIQASIFVRANDYRIDRQTPTRFRAQYRYGERFLWDFGDGTTSTEAQPLKTYTLSGSYTVTLTVWASETCQQTTVLVRELEVW
ncbi:MAG: hypothetical protein OHK0039_01480 [Bacteroidia bacterium]